MPDMPDKRYEATFAYDGVPPPGQVVTVNMGGAEFRGIVAQVANMDALHGKRKEQAKVYFGGNARWFSSRINGKAWRCVITG